VSWGALLALAAGIYALKAAGPLLLGGREPPPAVARVLGLVAVPLLAALVVTQTVGDGERIVLDARVPALAVAALCVWRRAPFLVTVLAAAAVAAGLRAVGG
jgi:branched-subunit amino acid transport protein